MRQHNHLPAMVGFVSKHVAQHLHTNRPRRSPAVSAKLVDAALPATKRFREHLPATSSALGQPRTSLLRRTVRAVQLCWHLQMRSRKPHPLGPNIVHMRKDRHNTPSLARRFRSPRDRVKTFNQMLVHAVTGRKHQNRGSVELTVNLLLTRGHGTLLLPHHTSEPRRSKSDLPIPNRLYAQSFKQQPSASIKPWPL
jgi:hypothetical protein